MKHRLIQVYHEGVAEEAEKVDGPMTSGQNGVRDAAGLAQIAD